MEQDIEELKEKYLNQDFDEFTFSVEPDVTSQYARLCGETAPRFLDPQDPDFQAPPTFLCCRAGGRAVPQGFPRLGVGFDAGKGMEPLLPVKPPITVTGRTHLHDIYTKTGRSGRMVFVVSRIEFYDADGRHLANSDTRIVMRERAKS